MEKFPSRPASPEAKPEKILSSEEVLEALSQHAEGFTLSRELSDEKGVYLREIEVQGEEEGQVYEYQYMRKGNHANHNQSDETVIRMTEYQDGRPVTGKTLARFNEETGGWKKI